MINDKKGQKRQTRAVELAKEIAKRYDIKEMTLDYLAAQIELDIKYNNGNWVNSLL